MTPVRTVLFDLDGTLLDSIGLIVGGFRHMMRIHRGVVTGEEDWVAGIGTPLAAQLARIARDADEAEAMRRSYSEYNVEFHDALTSAYPGVVDAVRELVARGVSLALVTSKKREGALRGLRHMALVREFPVVVAVDDVTHGKPHPEPVLSALRQLDADPATTVFVGDSTHDMASGRAAGVRVAAALWGPFSRESLSAHAPDWWLTQPSDLVPSLFGG